MKTQRNKIDLKRVATKNTVHILFACLTLMSATTQVAHAGWREYFGWGRRAAPEATGTAARTAVQTGQLISHRTYINGITDYLLSVKRSATGNDANLLIVTGQQGAGKTSAILSYANELQGMSRTNPLYGHRIQPIEIRDLITSSVPHARRLSPNSSDLFRLNKALDDLIQQAVQSENQTLFIPDYHLLFDQAPAYGDFVQRARLAFEELRKQRGLIIELDAEYLRQGSSLYAQAAVHFHWPLDDKIGKFEPTLYHLNLLRIADMTADETRRVLTSIKQNLSLRLHVEITDSAISTAINIAQKLRNPDKAFLAQALEALERGSHFVYQGMDPFTKVIDDANIKLASLQTKIDRLNQPQVIDGEFKRFHLDALQTELNQTLGIKNQITANMEPLRQHMEILSGLREQIHRNLERISTLETEMVTLRALPENNANTRKLGDLQTRLNELRTNNETISMTARSSEDRLKELGSTVRLKVDEEVMIGAQARLAGQTPETVRRILRGQLTDYFSPNLFEQLKRRIIGQDSVLQLIWQHLSTSLRSRIDPNKPLFIGLFNGPPGTGKTEVGKVIARDMYLNQASVGRRLTGDINDPNTWGTYVEINGASFGSEADVNKLVGAAPGYLGFDNPPPHIRTLLQAQAEGRPMVVVFDEIDKAKTTAVTNLLLKWLNGEGLMTSAGQRIDSRNLIFIFTSNAIDRPMGREEIIERLISGNWTSNNPGEVVTASTNPFTGPFLGRFTALPVFNHFNIENLKSIFQIYQGTHLRTLQEQLISYRVDTRLVDYIARISIGPTNGARELQNNFNRYIIGSLTRAVDTGLAKMNEGRSYVLSAEPFNPENASNYLEVMQVPGIGHIGITAHERR